jgi:hypothetical protein
MGWSNSVPIFHANITYTLQGKIPNVTIPFLDNAPIKGLLTRYEQPDGFYETHPDNPGIRHFEDPRKDSPGLAWLERPTFKEKNRKN